MSQQAIAEIKSHIERSGGISALWSIGVTTNADQQLFSERKVNKETDWWIFRKFEDHASALSGKNELLKLGASDDNEVSQDHSDILYAYKKSN